MIMKTIVLSGAIAGLAGMGPLLSELHKYGDTFPTALGFTGISVALLGRNHPAGIAVAAFVWAAIEQAARALPEVGIPPEIGKILQGTLLLSAVIAFEVVRGTARLQRCGTPPRGPTPRPSGPTRGGDVMTATTAPGRRRPRT
jgi:simple sugar transport system permease protein